MQKIQIIAAYFAIVTNIESLCISLNAINIAWIRGRKKFVCVYAYALFAHQRALFPL